jgi:arylsulfatase A-like enzyme
VKSNAIKAGRQANNARRGDIGMLSDILPLPDPRFQGRIGGTYVDSEADIISLRRPPEGAPNVVLVLLDDVGFGQTSTFGGPANTPTLQKLAEEGLRYNRFHTTALCSPTRAALLSGRNHHSVHTGVITKWRPAFPDTTARGPEMQLASQRSLQGNQYSTAAFGKWHNTPDHELSAAGPFDRWPTGKGFGYWYGFQGGEASQWHTPLFENTAPIEPLHENHYPVGWAWAGSSPFQWMKQVASHFGGTPQRAGHVVADADHRPGRAAFAVPPCYRHRSDDPRSGRHPRAAHVNGVPQKPIEGVSMGYTFDDPKAPSRRVTQYFEMLGNRALYHDGWVAGCLHGRLPWLTSGGASFDKDKWELYNIEDDFSQANDLAIEEPGKLRDLQDRFMAEAAKYNVLPLDDRFAQRANPALKPSHMRGKTKFVYAPGTIRIGERSSPNTKDVHHTLAAEVVIPEGGAEGVIVCCGGISSGFSLFMKDGKLYWEHNYYNEVRYRVTSAETIPPGRHVLSAEIKVDEEGKFGTGGDVTLRIGKQKVGKGRFRAAGGRLLHR